MIGIFNIKSLFFLLITILLLFLLLLKTIQFNKKHNVFNYDYAKNNPKYHDLLVRILSSELKKEKFENELSIHIWKKIFSEYDKEIELDCERGIEEEYYKLANFQKYDRYKSSFAIKKIFKDRVVLISEIKITVIHPEYGRYVDFCGLFGFFELKKNYNCSFAIYKFDEAIDLRTRKFKLGNKEFDSNFEIFYDNEELFRNIMSDKLIANYLSLWKKMGLNFEIKIINNRLFFRIYFPKLFEVNMENLEVSVKCVENNLVFLDNTFILIDELSNLFDELD